MRTSIESFNQSIDTWIQALEQCSLNELIAQPSPTSWSLGQLYKHLISETTYYLSRIEICHSSNRNAAKVMSMEGKEMFKNNSFPDERLQGGPANRNISQPVSKDALMDEFVMLRKKMNDAAYLIKISRYHGKSKHPGLNYFSAEEWIQFADMHMRHHRRQKARIDEFLSSSRTL